MTSGTPEYARGSDGSSLSEQKASSPAPQTIMAAITHWNIFLIILFGF
jgi:hypothetical protein